LRALDAPGEALVPRAQRQHLRVELVAQSHILGVLASGLPVREEGHRKRGREHAHSHEAEDRDEAGGPARGVFVVAHTGTRRSSSTMAAPRACFFWGI